MQPNPTRYALALKADSALEALLTARLHDPFNYLGAHIEQDYTLIRVFYPHARNVWISKAGNFEPIARIIHSEFLNGAAPLPHPCPTYCG